MRPDFYKLADTHSFFNGSVDVHGVLREWLASSVVAAALIRLIY